MLELPSGALVRGGARRHASPDAAWTVMLSGIRRVPERGVWLWWPDFGVPIRQGQAHSVVVDAWKRCATVRVQIACGGGVGRTGSVLAAMATLDGLPAAEAIEFVRSRYHPRAVETPWQRRWVEGFAKPSSPTSDA